MQVDVGGLQAGSQPRPLELAGRISVRHVPRERGRRVRHYGRKPLADLALIGLTTRELNDPEMNIGLGAIIKLFQLSL